MYHVRKKFRRGWKDVYYQLKNMESKGFIKMSLLENTNRKTWALVAVPYPNYLSEEKNV